MPHCYSQRMLNPFQGIVNRVEVDGGNAVCCDGESWTLFVHSEPGYAGLDNGSRRLIKTPNIKFGVWSEKGGLQCFPLRNTVDCDFVDRVGRNLLEAVAAKAHEIPFSLQDCYELWLLDSAFNLPLALIASANSRGQLSTDIPLFWRAGMSATSPFHVNAELAQQLKNENPAAWVGRVVNRAAGRQPRAQWFYRSAKGCGQAVLGVNVTPGLHGRVLAREAFPEPLLRSHWADETEQALVRAYLDWQAPWLLMLQNLSDATRDRLQQAAGRRAMAIHREAPYFYE